MCLTPFINGVELTVKGILVPNGNDQLQGCLAICVTHSEQSSKVWGTSHMSEYSSPEHIKQIKGSADIDCHLQSAARHSVASS